MLPASPQAAYNASKTSSESPKPSDKPSEEGAPGDAGSDEVTSPRTLRLTNKTRTWSAAELLSSDSESSDTGNNRPRGKKKKPRPKGTAKKSLHRSASEPSSQAGSSKKGLAQPSKKNFCKSGGGEPVGQPKTRKSPQKGPVHCKASSEKTSLNSANTTDAAVSLNSALPVKEASMDSGRTNANAKAPPALQRDKAVRQPTIKEKDSPYRCSVQGCPSNTDECCIGLWLFALPCEEDSAPLRSAWLNSVPIDEEVNRPRSPRVCFRHFEKDDFVSNKNRLAGLYEKAVPSIRIPTQTNPKVKCKSFQGNQPNVSIRTGAPVGSSNLQTADKAKFINRARTDGKLKSKFGISRNIGLIRARMISTTSSSSKVRKLPELRPKPKPGQISNISLTYTQPAVSSKTNASKEASSLLSSHSKGATTAGSISSSSNFVYHSKLLFHKETSPMSHCFSKIIDQSISVFSGTSSVPSNTDSMSQLKPVGEITSAPMPDVSQLVAPALLSGGTVATLEKQFRAPELTVAKKPFTASSGMKPTAECFFSASGLSVVEDAIKVMMKQKVVKETNLFSAGVGGNVAHYGSRENRESLAAQIDGTVGRSDSRLSLQSSELNSSLLPVPIRLPSTGESWSVGSKGEYQNRASSNSIGTTSLTCASSGKCEIVESSYAVTTQWDCSRGSAPLLSPSERLPQNVFSAVSSKHSSSQSAKEQTFERTAEVGAGSSESNHTTACNAAFASKDQCNTLGNIVAIGQECRREPSVLEREVIPYREHVSRPGSRSTCCTPDHSSVLTENGDSEQSEGSADEWVPFDPSHEKYVIEKQYIEGEDLGMSVYCKIRWLPTSAAAIKFGGGP